MVATDSTTTTMNSLSPQAFYSPPPSLQPIDEESLVDPISSERSGGGRRFFDSPISWNSSVPLETMWKSPMGSSIFKKPIYPRHNNTTTGNSSDDGDNDDDYVDKSSRGCTWSRMWNNGIRRFRIMILVLTIVMIWPCGMVSSSLFGNHRLEKNKKTEVAFRPVEGSVSELAHRAFARIFTNDYSGPMDPTLFIILESANTMESLADQSSSVYAAARNFTIGLNSFLSNHCWTKPGSNRCIHDEFFRVTSYYSLVEQKTPRLARDWMTPDGLSSLVEIKYLLPSDTEQHAQERLDQMMDAVDEYGSSPHLVVSYAGSNWFQSGLMEARMSDLYWMALLVLPVTLVIIGVMLPRADTFNACLLSLFTTFTTVNVWSIVLYNVIGVKMQIAHFTPPIMMSISLGFGMSSTLLLLTRYLEETQDRSVYRMLQKGGQTILVSGLVLIVTCLLLCLLPLPMIMGAGAGAATAVGSSLFANLIVLPALLHTVVGDWIFLKKLKNGNILAEGESWDEQIYLRHEQRQNKFFPNKSSILMGISGVMLFCLGRYLLQLQSSDPFGLLPPVNSPSLEAFRMFSDKVGLGSMQPYRILFDGQATNQSMISEEGFDLMHLVIDEITAVEDDSDIDGTTHVGTDSEEVQAMINNVVTRALARRKNQKVPSDTVEAITTGSTSCDERPATYAGVAVLDNARIPHSLYSSMEYCSKVKPYCPVEVLRVLHAVDKESTSADHFATFVNANPGYNPFSFEGIEWLRSARETIVRLEKSGVLRGVEVHIVGAGAIANDAVAIMYESLPMMIGITVLVVFCFLVICLENVVSVVRTMCTSSLALAVCVAFGELFCNFGILDWLNIKSLSSGETNVYWLVPVVIFNIAGGVALSFDLLVNKLNLDHRLDCYKHRSIISATGTIMVFSFGSMMICSTIVLKQLSFLLAMVVFFEMAMMQNVSSPYMIGTTSGELTVEDDTGTPCKKISSLCRGMNIEY